VAEKDRRGFEDLDCYKMAVQVFKESYRVAKGLPPDEKYNLSLQIRRAATSIVLNIAEGYGRYHYLDSLRFYYYARGSLSETLGAFILCDEARYTRDELSRQRDLCNNALRALNGYIRYVRAQKQGCQEYGNRSVHEEPGPYTTWLPEENNSPETLIP
jgi:four helix bundle protein